jgi:hypothetical protein
MMMYDTGKNMGHTEIKFQKPEDTQNNLDPKNEHRPREAGG